ncbi:MAG: hypothetical protein PHU05_02325 [Bacilli bacterium]|nr:hypothetical protein [Bacilli bacterium]
MPNEERIKQDCIMYINKIKKCNGLTILDCENCSFYNNTNKEKYIKDMQDRGLYIGYEYNREIFKNKEYRRCYLTPTEREGLK